MRLSLALVLSLLLAGAAVGAASAEARLSSRIVGGIGVGGGHDHGYGHVAPSYLVAADLLWRRGPERSWVVSLEACGAEGASARYYPQFLVPATTFPGQPSGRDPAPRRLDSVRHEAVLIGIERSRVGAGFGSFLHAEVGMGLVTTQVSSIKTATGLALGGGAGFRLVSPARELGLSLGLRTSHVIGRGARSHFLALTFGAAINPR